MGNAINVCSRMRGIFLLLVATLAMARAVAADAPTPIKVVVVPMFETGRQLISHWGTYQDTIP